jgi:hypothetical protein
MNIYACSIFTTVHMLETACHVFLLEGGKCGGGRYFAYCVGKLANI